MNVTVHIPLSKEAVSILRPIRKKGAVFPTLSPYILNHKVPLLIEAAGILLNKEHSYFRIAMYPLSSIISAPLFVKRN